jgi:DNA-binding IclR family transcriptional regulator
VTATESRTALSPQTPEDRPAADREPTDKKAISSSVTKAFRIVEMLAGHASQGLSLGDLSARLNMPKSTTHRYLATLESLELAERDGADRFRLGTRVIELAGSYLANADLRIESHALLEEVAAQTGETVHLAVPSGDEVVYIAKVESIHALRMYSHIGARLPMHCTALGKALLAHLPPERAQRLTPGPLAARTPRTITSAAALARELDLIRQQGFAIDDEENEVGVCCVGAPVFDYTGAAVAALSLSGPMHRMSRERCVQLGPLVREAARRLSRRMGCQAQEGSPATPTHLEETHSHT